MRLPSLVAVGLAAATLAPSAALAQGEDAPTVTTSAVFLREAGATAAQSAIVSIGLRRGLREVEGVRFVHPVDVLSTPEYSQEVQDAIDELEPVADMVRTGDARYAANRAAEIAELFEANLERVRRSQLVDAYMLSAIGECQAGRRRECEEQLAEIIAWREGLQYDPERYGPESEEVFQRVRARSLSGARGTLVVETEPEGAEVYIDGRSYGPSPARAEGLLAGHHYVTIKEIGHLERIVRADVRGGREEVARYELTPNPRARLIVGEEAEAAIRGELGTQRAGDSVRSMGNTLGVTQIIVGVLRPAAGEQVHVQLYLYHVHTRLLQKQTEATLTTDEAGMERARQIAIDLYEGVDLTGGVEAPEDDTVIAGPQPEIYEQWWFWAAVIGGAALVAGSIAIGATVATDQQIPDGVLRFTGELP
jgi:hypothetical protein